MALSKQNLPSVAVLQTFVTAARTLNFAAAADELFLSPAAVSQQIRSLETQLNVKLFSRSGRTVRLTDAGVKWLPEVRECLDVYERTIGLATNSRNSRLSITAAPSFASRWLMSRLPTFSEREPDINVRLIATPEVLDLWDEDLDLAIRYGPGDYPGLSVTKLMPEYLIPMCSPSLLERGPKLEVPSDLAKYPLIHDESTSVKGGAWGLWLRAAGARNVKADSGARFSIADLALQSAADGRGVALGRMNIAGPELESGQLICPFDLTIESPFSYYVVTRPEIREAEQIDLFREWILSESEADQKPHHIMKSKDLGRTAPAARKY